MLYRYIKRNQFFWVDHRTAQDKTTLYSSITSSFYNETYKMLIKHNHRIYKSNVIHSVQYLD